MNDTPFAMWLRTERAHRRESQQEVADAVHKTRGWISHLEAGLVPRPHLEDVALLADHFDADVRKIVDLAGFDLKAWRWR